jgi:general stress protein 26
MHTPDELQRKFWDSLGADRTVMLGLEEERPQLRPMTAQVEDGQAPIWFFTTKDNFVAAWYEGGKGDPKLALLRFEPDDAQIWLSESGLLAGARLLLGGDPKKDLAGNVAKVRLS